MNKSTQNIVGGGVFLIIGLIWVILSVTALSDSSVKSMFIMGGAAFFIFGAMQLATAVGKDKK